MYEFVVSEKKITKGFCFFAIPNNQECFEDISIITSHMFKTSFKSSRFGEISFITNQL